MKLRNAWVMALALCSASAAYAADDESTNWYFGLSASSFDFERKGTGSHSYNTHGMVAKVGYDLGSYLSIEGRMGVGDEDDDGTNSVRAAWINAAYLRFNLPLDKIKVYVLGGYSSIYTQVNLIGVDSSHDDLAGVSYGVGIELYGNQTTALTAEFARYVEEQTYEDAGVGLDNKFDVNALSFGFVHHF